jgi:4-azaleucine resistance transporter AzlC
VRAELPILAGVLPFGLIYGVLAIAAGLPPALAQAMSCILFAGSAQIVMTRLVASGAPGIAMLLTAFVVNLRHMLYSASVAPYLRGLPRRWRLLLAYLLTDEAYVVTILHYERPGALVYKHWFFLGAGLALWASWQASTAAGVFLGQQVPAAWGLDFTLALTFIGLVVPVLVDRGAIAAAAAAGVTSVVAGGLPLQLGLMAAALAGILAGLVAERSTDRRLADGASPRTEDA